MNGMLAVTTREVRMKALVPLAGLLSGVTILLVGALVQKSGNISEIGQALLILSFVFLSIIAGSLGVTMVGRELAGPRSVFLLSGPVSNSAIYFGKILAAILLALVSTALFVLPAVVSGMQQRIDRDVIFVCLVLAITMVTICAALEVLARARTLHLILWVGLSTGIVWLAWKAGEPFRLASVNGVVYLFILLALGVIILGTLIAHAAAFVAERYDVRSQAHRFSILYLSMIAVVALVIAASSWALLHLPVSSLHRFIIHDTSPDGSSVIVAGTLRDSEVGGAFAIDLEESRTMRLPLFGYRGAALSADHAFWTDVTSETDLLRMTTLSKGSGIRSGIVFGEGRIAAVASDGRHIAWVTGATTQIITAEGTTVMTISNSTGNVRGPAAVRGVFESPSLLRMYEWDGSHWSILVADLSRRSLDTVGSFEGTAALLTSAGRRPIVRVAHAGLPDEFHEIDPATASVTLRIPSPSSVPTPLSDGGWAFINGENALSTIDRNGTITARAIPARGKMRTGGEIRPGLLLVHDSSADSVHERAASIVHILDLGSGRILASYERTIPVARIFRSHPPVGSPAWRLVETDDGLQLIDATTLELHPVIR